MSNRVEGERVFCYQCENEWDRAHGGLQCPRCESEFVEILPPGGRPDVDDPPEVTPEPSRYPEHDNPMRSLREHYPWRHDPRTDPNRGWEDHPDPDEPDIRTIHFNTGGGGNGSFTFSRTYTTGFGNQRGAFNGQAGNPTTDTIMRDFEGMVNNILGGHGRMRAGNFGGTHGMININGRTTTFGSGTQHDDFPGFMGPSPYVIQVDAFAHDTNDLSRFSMFPEPMTGGNARARGMGGPGAGGPMNLFDLIPMLLNPANAQHGDAVFSQEALDRIMSQLMEQNANNGPPPAPQELINQLPKKKVDEEMLGNDHMAECSICMDNVEVGTEVTILPCQHWFHFECIESWLKEHDTCPHCRKPITPEDQRQQQQQTRQHERSNSMTDAMRMMRERTREDRNLERTSSERRPSRRTTTEQDQEGGGVTGWLRSHNPFG